MVIRHLVWLLWLCLALVFGPAQAGLVDVAGQLEWNKRLSEQALVYEDMSGAMGPDQIAALPTGPGSFRSASQVRNPGIRSFAPWWVKVSLANTGDTSRLVRVVLNPGTVFHTADFYTEAGTGWRLAGRETDAPGAASNETRTTRFHSVVVDLPPGANKTLLIRTTGAAPTQLAPYLYTDSLFQDYLSKSAIWDGLLFGGLLALAWAAWMLALFTRSRPFLVLGLLSFVALLTEAVRRDYIPFISDAVEWSYRAPLVLGNLSILLFLVFVLEIARSENVRLPLRRLFVAWILYNVALVVIAAFGDVYLIYWLNHYLRTFQSLTLLLIAVLFILQNAPTRKLMLAVAAFSVARAALMVLENNGTLPSYIADLSIGALRMNPVLALSSFFLNLTLLAAWVAHVGNQRKAAMDKISEMQREENRRLTKEVTRQTAALNKALAYADEKNRQQTQIVSYISHDLRAPLSTASGYTKLIERTATDEQKPLLRAIERSIDYQLALIDDILAYATAELKPLATEPHRVQLSDYLDEITVHAVALSKQHDNEFTIRVSSQIPKTIYVDGRRLRQVLLNLLSNAAKFTRRGHIRLIVSATQQPDDTSWRLYFAISDSGIGIDTEVQAQIFQEFSQADEDSGGVGLGLYIAQSILRSMGSELDLESSPNNGTTFRFHLDVEAPDTNMLIWASPADQIADMFNETTSHVPSSVLAATPSAPDTVDASDAVPPPHIRNALALMARDGQLSDIERWLGTMSARYPAYTAYLDKIQEAVSRLDLEAVERLALAKRN